MTKAIIFDFGGVIVDTEENRFLIFQQLLKQKGIFLTDKDRKIIAGRKTKEILDEMFGKKTRQEVKESIHSEYKRQYFQKNIEIITPIKTTIEIINKYSGTFLFGLASMNSLDTITTVLGKLGILKNFSVIVSKEDVKKPKPDPEIYIKAITQLKCKPEECIGIEDSNVGAKAVLFAGMRCGIIINSHTQQQDFENLNIEKFITTLQDFELMI